MKIIAFIPVRQGSKGIPGKNIKELGGKPLICWVLDTLLKSRIADEIWVATDSDEIHEMIRATYRRKINIYRRTRESATDTAPTIWVVNEFLDLCSYEPDDRFVLLQATSPFTTVAELKALKTELLKNEHDSHIACCRLKKFRWSEDGRPLDYTFADKPRRQDYKGLLIESGAYYASRIGSILTSGQLLSGTIQVMEISAAGLIDIDEPADWQRAESYIQHQS